MRAVRSALSVLSVTAALLATGCADEPTDEPALGTAEAELIGPPGVDDQCKAVVICIGPICITVGNQPDGTACDDGSACTTADSCQAGRCVGGPALACDDGNACTDDACDPAAGCVATDNTAPCDDGDACTQIDVCSAGACVGGAPVVCEGTAIECRTGGTCDPATGACIGTTAPDGTACGDGCGRCAGGACGAMFIATAPAHYVTSGLAVDATSVYFGDALFAPNPPFAIRRAPKDGGPATVIVADAATHVAIDGDHVYYTSGWLSSTVRFASLAGGAPAVLASMGLVNPRSIALDETHVFFTDFFGDAVYTISKTANDHGGEQLQLIHLAHGQDGADSIVVTPDRIYWTVTDAVRASAPGGPIEIAGGQNGPSGLAADDTHVYWTTDDGQVKRAPRAGGPETVLATGQAEPGAITVDGDHVYWMNHSGGIGTTIGRVARTGGPVAIIAAGGVSADVNDGIVVDGACVYWSAHAIFRAPK